MKILNLLSAFQILLYPGSHVKNSYYTPLIQDIEERIQMPINQMNGSFLRLWNQPEVFKKPTFLIGHSLGGYLALLDALRYPESVQGVVLLHSHFNSRGKACYPKINQQKVDTPVLTILASDDERLSFRIAIDDLFEKVKERLYNKYYIINPHFTHFSGCTPFKTNETIIIANQIAQFINDTKSDNFTLTRSIADVSKWDAKIPNFISGSLLSKSTSLLDALLQVVMFRSIWETWHWLWFLLSKPDINMDYFYETERYIYMKTYNLPIGHIQNKIRELSFSKHVDFKCIQLPSCHPFILAWLGCPLYITNNMTFPILKYPINRNVTYYKIPHPNRVLEKQIIS